MFLIKKLLVSPSLNNDAVLMIPKKATSYIPLSLSPDLLIAYLYHFSVTSLEAVVHKINVYDFFQNKLKSKML